MTEIHYCIICGTPFETSNPQAVLCPEHERSSEAKSELSSLEEIVLESIPEPQVDQPSSTRPSDWQPGDVILDTYEVRQVFTSGGMGLVYRVHHRGWNIDLALKSPRPELFVRPEGAESFVREAETWVDLGLHPHIVSCYYVRTIEGIPRIFAEYVEGGSLKDWIEDRRLYQGGEGRALERILDIAIQFAWGLQYAHEQGLVHQDVKPANLLMTPEGGAKVSDFGLTKARLAAGEVVGQVGGGSLLVSSGGYTPAYCSPEQAAQEQLSRRTDIWSWALSVLEMFTGEVVWMSGVVAASALENYLEYGAEGRGIPATPQSLVELLGECFQDEPRARPRDMLTVADRLVDIYQQATGQVYTREMPKAIDLRADSLNNKALSMLDLEKVREALQEWESALETDPLHIEATYNLGLYRWRAGLQMVSDLENKLQSICTAKPESWRCAYLLGMINLESGDVESAREIFEEVDQHFPKNPEVQRALSFIDDLTIEVGERIFQEHHHVITDIKVSKHENLVFSIDMSFNLRVWNLQDLSCIKAYDLSGVKDPEDESLGYPFMALIERDNQVLVGGYDDFSFKQWDLVTGRCLNTFQGHTKEVQDIDIDSGNLHVISGSSDETIRLWDLQTGVCEKILQSDQNAAIFSVLFTLDGKNAITGCDNGDVIIWDLDRGQKRKVLEGHDGTVYSLAITPEGDRLLTVGHDGNAILWDLRRGQMITLLTARGMYSDRSYAWSVAISPEGRLGCVGDEFGRLEVWDLKCISLLRLLQGHQDAIISMAFTPDNHYLLACSRDTNLLHDITFIDRKPADWALCLPSSAHKEYLIAAEAEKHLDQARTALQHNDFKEVKRAIKKLRGIAGYEWHQEVYEIWQEAGIRAGSRVDLRGFRKKRSIEKIVKGPVKISQDGKRALIADISKLKYYDLESGKLICEMKIDSHDAVQVIDMADNLGLSGSAKGGVHVWSLDNGECLAVLNESPSCPYWISFFHAGQSILMAREDGCINLWNWKSSQKFSRELNCLDEGIIFSAFDPVNLTAALTVQGKELFLMDLEHGMNIKQVNKGIYGGQLYSIKNIVISPDGNRLFFENQLPDNQLGIWDLVSRHFSEYLIDYASKATLSPDGRFLAISRYFWNPENSLKDEGNLQIIQLKDTGEILTGSTLQADRSDLVLSDSLDEDVNFIKTEVTLESGNISIDPIAFSLDGRYLFAARENDLQIWELFWDYEFPEQKSWDEGALPYLEAFLNNHLSNVNLLNKTIKSTWTEDDFQRLLYTLGCAGYGWLRPEGVRRKLEEMARKRV